MQRAFFICFLVALFYGYEYFLRVAPSVLQFELIETYQISSAGLGLISAAFYYAYVPLQLPVGLLMDRFGPRNILTFACLLCAVGTDLFIRTDWLSVALISRFILGFGSAFAFVGMLKITHNWLPRKYFALMSGFATTLGMLGGIAGQKFLHYCAIRWSWQGTLQMSVWVGLILSFVIWLWVKNTPPQSVHSHALVQPKSESDTAFEWLFAIKTVIPNLQIWIVGTIGCLNFLVLSVFAELWAVPFMNEGLNLDLETATTASAFIFIGFGLGGPIWGWFSDYIQSRKIPMIIGSFLAALVGCFILFVLSPDQNYFLVALNVSMFLLGFFSSCEILVFAIGSDLASTQTHATSVAFINFLVMIGGSFLLPVIGILLDASQQNYVLCLSVLPLGLTLGGLISLFWLQESYHKNRD